MQIEFCNKFRWVVLSVFFIGILGCSPPSGNSPTSGSNETTSAADVEAEGKSIETANAEVDIKRASSHR